MRKNNPIKEAYELANYIPWLGIGGSFVFASLTVISVIWAKNMAENTLVAKAFEHSIIQWILPVVFLMITVLFLIKTITIYLSK